MGGDVVEIHAPVGRKRLRTAVDVRDELERVYRAAARGKLSMRDATSLTYILSQQLKAIEIADIEPALLAAQEVQRQYAR